MSKRVIKENEKAPKGHGPGKPWGVNMGKVGNKCGEGAGKGQWKKVGRVNPGSNKGTA